MYVGVKIRIGATNRKTSDLLDLARRQFDHLGRDGITAKRHQKIGRYRGKGFLRFPLRNRAQVRTVIDRINQLGEPAIKVTRFRNPNSYPF